MEKEKLEFKVQEFIESEHPLDNFGKFVIAKEKEFLGAYFVAEAYSHNTAINRIEGLSDKLIIGGGNWSMFFDDPLELSGYSGNYGAIPKSARENLTTAMRTYLNREVIDKLENGKIMEQKSWQKSGYKI
ncbi:hypothetical protein C0585_03660 [Candidatus Woesearchaeota archaeon]|nr:MAG: hypothetical protein C0585_03660 [Candidatus Woesearchaeota archaeon]